MPRSSAYHPHGNQAEKADSTLQQQVKRTPLYADDETVSMWIYRPKLPLALHK
jgi:hypothetical protein